MSLLNIIIPSSVTTIGDYAFYGCTNLQTATISNPNTTIGEDIFLGDTALTLIHFCGPYTPGLTFPPDVTVQCDVPCFKEDTKILCLNDLKEEVYIPIQYIKPGMLVKTLNCGYVPVNIIGTLEFNNPEHKNQIKNRLYQYSKYKYPQLFENLIMTGGHKILVDQLSNNETMKIKQLFPKKTNIELSKMFISHSKYKLMTYLNDNVKIYDKSGPFNIWNLALNNENKHFTYGIYANGLLVESSSIEYMTEKSGMKLMKSMVSLKSIISIE